MKYIKDLIYISIICIVTFLLLKQCNEKKTQGINYKAELDSLVKTHNKKDSSETASISSITGDQKDAKDFIRDTDTGKRVKKTIKKDGNKVVSSTAIDLHTDDSASGKTTVIYFKPLGVDTLRPKDPCIGIAYTSEIVKRRASYKLYMDKDSSHVTAYVDNKIDLNVEYTKLKFKDFLKKPGRLFAPDTLKARVIAYNPGTDIDEMTSYNYTQKKKNAGAKIAAGTVIITELIRILILKNP